MVGGYIDSRDLEARLDELTDDTEYGPLDEDEAEERAALTRVCNEGRDSFSEWHDGETLVPEDQWIDYAQQLAEDIGAIAGSEGWPLSYIDWERAAEALKQDYTGIDIEGTEYWGRA
jgi:hypothetical protein